MVNEKEPKKVTRRQFVKGALALGASALIGPGCQPDQPPSSQPEKSTDPTPTPTKEASPTPQSPTATKEPTAIPTPEATPTPEARLVAGVDITKDYLEKAFTGIGGGETIDNGQEEVSFVRFGQDYVGQSWGEEAAFASLSEDPIASIKYLISLGAYQGRLGLYSPGKEGEEIIFPGLVEDKEGQETLALLRLELTNLPPKDEEEDDYSEWVFPQGLRLEKGTQMTVLGHLEQDQEETKLHYAVAAFTDYHRVSQDGVPRHYLALIPSHFPADPDNKQTLTLANLLTLNGYDYDPAQKAIAFTDPKTKEDITWQLNKFVGQDFHQDLFRAAGLAFVDQINDDQIRNPILPYPQGVKDQYQLEREDNQFLFTGQDQSGQEVTLKAAYDHQKEVWEWEEMGVADMVGVVEREGEEFQVVEINGQQKEVLKIEGLSLKWNKEKERFEYFDVDSQKVAHWVFSEEGGGSGSLEITPPVNKEGLRYLDFEKHLGLFAPLLAEESNEIFYRYWNQNQEIRIPLPLDVSRGGIVEEKRVSIYSLNFKNLKEGTTVFSPMEIESSKGGFGKDKAWVLSFKKNDNSELMGFVFPPQGEFLSSGRDVSAGDPVIRLAGDYFPEKLALGLYKDYQLNISRSNRGEHIGFSNLIKDFLGRITYLSGQ